MSQSQGEGSGQFHIAIDARLRAKFDKLPAKVQQELRNRLIAASIDSTAARAVLIEGEYIIDGTVLDGEKLYYYSGVRFSYDPQNHVIILTSIPDVEELKRVTGPH